MGYSEGSFKLDTNIDVHWELRNNGTRLILWNADESHILLRIRVDQALEMYKQLQGLIYMMYPNEVLTRYTEEEANEKYPYKGSD